jgi:hypothetical protein
LSISAPPPVPPARKTIVVVHGVGPAELGEIGNVVVKTIAAEWGAGVIARRTLGGDSFQTIQFADGPVQEILEVNWADIRRPAEGFWGVILHFFALLSAWLHLGRANTRLVRGWPSRFSRWYQAFAEAFVIWSPLPMLTCLWTATHPGWAPVIVFTAAAFTFAFSNRLAKLSGDFGWGRAWAVAIAAGGVAAWHTEAAWEITKASIHIYAAAQLLATVLALAALAAAIYANHGESWDRRLAGMAFTYVPYVAISTLGPALFAAAMALALKGDRGAADRWAAQFTDTLRYDLRFMEYVFASAVAAIGLFLLVGVLRYARESKQPSVPAGQRVQDWFRATLALAPIVLLLVAAAMVVSISRPHRSLDGAGVMYVYGLSALRIVPFLPFLTPTLRIVVDVAGDVAFYLAPHNVGLAIYGVTHQRFKNALGCLSSVPDSSLTVVAHSQGSVLALEGLGNFEGRLATIGSPLGSLYGRFLPAAIWTAPVPRPGDWLNIYCCGDYIGGPIPETRNVAMPLGGHTGYWRDAAAWKIILGP